MLKFLIPIFVNADREYSIIGTPAIGVSAFDIDFVKGCKRVPDPAARTIPSVCDFFICIIKLIFC